MTFYSRNLPHFHPKNKTLFITCRLTDSIPVHMLGALRKNYEFELENLFQSHSKSFNFKNRIYDLQKKYFGKYDKLLDSMVSGPDWLKHDCIAELVWNKIHDFNKIKFELVSLSILYNHFHLVIHPDQSLKVSESNKKGKTKSYVIADTLRLIKGSTSREANKILKRQGRFWHHESYDHFVRDKFELDRIVQYVIKNPGKAGLTQPNATWKWSMHNDSFPHDCL